MHSQPVFWRHIHLLSRSDKILEKKHRLPPLLGACWPGHITLALTLNPQRPEGIPKSSSIASTTIGALAQHPPGEVSAMHSPAPLPPGWSPEQGHITLSHPQNPKRPGDSLKTSSNASAIIGDLTLPPQEQKA